jgi:hypothetical protein
MVRAALGGEGVVAGVGRGFGAFLGFPIAAIRFEAASLLLSTTTTMGAVRGLWVAAKP